jgi:hypothetical protein
VKCADYVDFMLTSNGGEGLIGGSYVVLWPIEDLLERNADYRAAEFAPGLLLFGSRREASSYPAP